MIAPEQSESASDSTDNRNNAKRIAAFYKQMRRVAKQIDYEEILGILEKTIVEWPLSPNGNAETGEQIDHSELSLSTNMKVIYDSVSILQCNGISKITGGSIRIIQKHGKYWTSDESTVPETDSTVASDDILVLQFPDGDDPSGHIQCVYNGTVVSHPVDPAHIGEHESPESNVTKVIESNLRERVAHKLVGATWLIPQATLDMHEWKREEAKKAQNIADASRAPMMDIMNHQLG